MGMNNTDIGVYIFLFTQKLFETKTQFSVAEIVKSIKSITGFAPEEFRMTLSDNAVSKSISKLTALGFVNKCKNTKTTKSPGRPAAALYETIDLHTTTGNVTKRLDLYRHEILGALERLADVEEGVGLSEGIKGHKQ